MTRPGPETSHSGAAAASFSAGPLAFLQDPDREILLRVSGAFQGATGARKRGQIRSGDLRPAVYPPRGRSSARGLPEGLLQPSGRPAAAPDPEELQDVIRILEAIRWELRPWPELRPAPAAGILSSWPGSERGPSAGSFSCSRRRSGRRSRSGWIRRSWAGSAGDPEPGASDRPKTAALQPMGAKQTTGRSSRPLPLSPEPRKMPGNSSISWYA